MDWSTIVSFFKDNWELITANIWTFLLFGGLVAICTVTICSLIFKSQIKDLKERKALQKEVQKLKGKCKSLEEQIRDLTIDERMLRFAEESVGTSSAGKHISTALKKRK